MLGIKLGDLCKSSASSEPSLQPYEILNEEEGNKVKEINKVKNEFVKGKTAGR